MISPLFLGERPGFEQNAVGDAHLTDIVQQGAAANLDDLVLADTHRPGEPDRHLGDPPAMPFGLLIAEIQGMRPALDRGVVGEGQLGIRPAQPFVEADIFHRNGRLAREQFQEVGPLLIDHERGTMEDLEDPLHLALGQQRDRVVSDKPFLGEIVGTYEGFIG